MPVGNFYMVLISLILFISYANSNIYNISMFFQWKLKIEQQKLCQKKISEAQELTLKVRIKMVFNLYSHIFSCS